VSKRLEDLEEEILRCSRCGTCRQVCPVFAETLTEVQVARGKIALAGAALDGRIDASRELSRRMTLCLNCKTCVEKCPSGVRADEIVLAARDRLHREGKNPFLKHAFIDQVWTRGRVFARFMQTASGLQPLLFRRERDRSARSRIALPGLDPDRRVPVLASESLLSRLPKVVSPAGASRMRVGLFLGCATNWVYPEIGESVVRILSRAGIEVVIPEGQECCGVPMLNAGDFDKAAAQRDKNRTAFREYTLDAIVTACASCGLALKKEMDEILEDGPYLPGVPIYDVSEFLVRGPKIEIPGALDPVRVTYHDPCHLRRGQGIVEEPRRLLRAIPGVELVEMPEADRCCGGGGLFSLSHYDVAQKIGARKAEAIRESGADLVVTGCPACMMQLTDALARSGHDAQVIHTAALLARAFG